MIFNTYGGMGRDCEEFNRRLTQLVSEKGKVSFGSVMTHIRTWLRFALLRSDSVGGQASQAFQDRSLDDVLVN